VFKRAENYICALIKDTTIKKQDVAIMPIGSKTEAQKRVDRINAFRAELDALHQEGVLKLDDNQQAAIAQHHQQLLSGLSEQFDVDQDLRSRQLSLGMRIASFLGAVALALSVFFMFYQFWGKLTTGIQI
jgi:hypothetical protein